MDPPVCMKLSTPTPAARVGSQIRLDAVTTNISQRTVAVGFLPGPYESPVLTLTLQVRDSNNVPVGPEQVDQHSCQGKPRCRVLYLESRYLAPGESVTDHFVLDSKYNLAKPGRYTAQLVRWDRSPGTASLEGTPDASEKAITAVSNRIVLTLSEVETPSPTR